MTTLAANKPRTFESGSRNELPVIADDCLYEGAAAGLVNGSGHIRPLTAVDRFAGFMEEKADNTGGAAAAINGRLIESGKIRLPIANLVITDQGLPVYATDDDTFSLSPVGGVFVGFVHRFEAAGYGIVKFDALNFRDPYEGWAHELKSANYTVDAEDVGKWIWVDTDGVVVTLPAVEGIAKVRIGNLGAFGAVGVSVSPNASDMIEAPDVTAADNKDMVNTKATACRGDYLELGNGDANGWCVTAKRGTWAREA